MFFPIVHSFSPKSISDSSCTNSPAHARADTRGIAWLLQRRLENERVVPVGVTRSPPPPVYEAGVSAVVLVEVPARVKQQVHGVLEHATRPSPRCAFRNSWHDGDVAWDAGNEVMQEARDNALKTLALEQVGGGEMEKREGKTRPHHHHAGVTHTAR